MIPNIVRGGNTARLVSYLVGRGRANEHVNPHIVAGVTLSELTDKGNGATLDTRDAAALTSFLDARMRLYEKTVKRALNSRRQVAQRDEAGGGEKTDAHVWHSSLAAAKGERAISDEEWNAIANRYMALMGWNGADAYRDTIGEAPEIAGVFDTIRGGRGRIEKMNYGAGRWVAIHHGPMKNGNDHIHIVANAVCEDGRVWEDVRDQPRSQAACAIIEREFGLHVVDGHQHQRGQRGYRAGELESDHRRGLDVGELAPTLDGGERVDPATAHPLGGTRGRLERVVRAAAVAARDEVDFVALLRSDGVIALPRWDRGGRDHVIGYSVKQPGRGAARYGGRSLASDLTIHAIRAAGNWPTLPASVVADAWRHPKARTPLPPGPELLARAERGIIDLRQQLAQVDAGDRVTWAHAARDAAGVLNTWSLLVEPEPGPLAEAAHALAATAALHRMIDDRRRWLGREAARLAANALREYRPARNSRELLRQVSYMTRQLIEMHTIAAQEQRAFDLELRSLSAIAALQQSAGAALAPADAAADVPGADTEPDHTAER